MPEKKTIAEMPYEEAFEVLEARVHKLESGSLSLEEALAAFEEGQEAAKRCDELLEQAELKLSKLVPGQEGAFEEQPLPQGEDA